MEESKTEAPVSETTATSSGMVDVLGMSREQMSEYTKKIFGSGTTCTSYVESNFRSFSERKGGKEEEERTRRIRKESERGSGETESRCKRGYESTLSQTDSSSCTFFVF